VSGPPRLLDQASNLGGKVSHVDDEAIARPDNDLEAHAALVRHELAAELLGVGVDEKGELGGDGQPDVVGGGW
jgi:hypothetical protein